MKNKYRIDPLINVKLREVIEQEREEERIHNITSTIHNYFFEMMDYIRGNEMNDRQISRYLGSKVSNLLSELSDYDLYSGDQQKILTFGKKLTELMLVIRNSNELETEIRQKLSNEPQNTLEFIMIAFTHGI